MAKFYANSNNGVTAVMTEEAYLKLEERRTLIAETERKGLGTPNLPQIGPIFTFGRGEHRSFKCLTGSTIVMNRLLDDHEVLHGNIWVPFSNGAELGIHGREEQQFELQFMTSLDEAVEAFGLMPSDI
ncbi:hypothetical protein A2886_01460 [candidate division WWE3 bacterium RIFCSPHIGHO2_01_FULL_42_13]|uniref:Uncharacterized protein n=1 Tax=candidate division WWE3 bacterium RIFCSPHIGHO2_01_FULL_42_13 TaxID=1802617 RepID=A0A1F4USL7_UNCKA|nr:MAG: hypothetical protein A2886_01460 [candidate division WWE3 bacterium RIFCSPHIGHO2_01_FULL_42_13]